MFWLISFILLALASLFILFPYWKYYRGSDSVNVLVRTEANLTIFRERQTELETELANGNLDQPAFDALLLELKKTLLIDTGSQSELAQSCPSLKGKLAEKRNKEFLNKAVPLTMVILVPVLAYLLYGQWGYLNDVELMDYYERTITSTDNPEESRELVVSLGQVVQADEENEWAWYFLGRNLSNLGMFQEAEIAFQEASDLMPDGPDKAATLGFYAQIKYVVSGGELTDDVKAIVGRAMAINPSDMASLQLLSLDAETNGDYQAAIGYWRLMIQANPNSRQAQDLRANIAAAQAMLAQQAGDEGMTGPRIEVNVELADSLELPDNLTVFVTARDASKEGIPPLAVMDMLVSDLPGKVTLDDSLAVGPFNLSSATTVYITATVSRTGSATVQPGDFRVISQNFAHNGQHSIIDLVISEMVQ